MEPDREEDPVVRHRLRARPATAAASDVDADDEQQALLLDWSTARATWQRIVDESGLVEFEVGKALYGLVTAGFLHRVGKSTRRPDAAARPKRRVDEHRNLGIAFYKTGMLDEASARVPPRARAARRATRTARFYVGLVLARQGKWTEAVSAFAEAASAARRQAGGVPQPRVSRSSGWAGTTRRTSALGGGRAARRRDRSARADVARRA